MSNTSRAIKRLRSSAKRPSFDSYMRARATKFYLNLFNIIDGEISDHDLWKFPAKIFSKDEIATMYEHILPQKQRENQSGSDNFKLVPELDKNDIWEVLDFLYSAPRLREKFRCEFATMLENKIAGFEQALLLEQSRLQEKFKEMKELFNLSDIECDLILFILLSESNFWDLGDYSIGGHTQRLDSISIISAALDISEQAASELFYQKSTLRKFGIICQDDIQLDDGVKSYLDGISSIPLCDRYYTKYSGDSLLWEMHGPLAQNEGEQLLKLINAKQPDSGQNILLYGYPGTGKSSFVKSLANKLGKDLYFINMSSADGRRTDYSPAFRFGALEVANLRLNPNKTIICVDECDKLISNEFSGGGFMRMMGMPMERNFESKGILNTVLDGLKLTTVWIANSRRESIDPSSRRRFDYNIFFDSMSLSTRKFVWNNALKRYSRENAVPQKFIDEVSTRYEVNAGGIDIAVKNAAAICAANTSVKFEDEIITCLKAHCKILDIPERTDYNCVSKDYSLEGLNIKSGPTPDRITDACRNFIQATKTPGGELDTPRMNILLAGAPGTGKTEFVKYLAKTLGVKLTVKMASDLLDCYVGSTEQRIVNAFEEASAERAILFIDEGDSMLGSRERAARSWEMTQVTTLLNQMERFDSIFIMATNFARNLDPAAIRRFTFKLQFDYLDAMGKECFYKKMFAHLNLPALKKAEFQELSAVEKLTPGDFRNVRQQFFYLADSQLTNGEIIRALTQEANAKDQKKLDCFGEKTRSIGF